MIPPTYLEFIHIAPNKSVELTRVLALALMQLIPNVKLYSMDVAIENFASSMDIMRGKGRGKGSENSSP
jgi:hypothetical protein